MKKTVRLFDENSKINTFEATVISCELSKDNCFALVLDRTAFFPNEGGQSCDKGTIDGIEVLSVDEEDGIIIHFVKSAFEPLSKVTGRIDFEKRFRKMQNHTAEHIVSGIIYKLFGYSNVGFHLGDGYMTADFDGELKGDDIEKIEHLANTVIFECKAVRAYYPDTSELHTLEYRSKIDLSENVRIVEIDGVDMCACCAPHVDNTGEIGIVKIVDSIRYKGGVRLTMIAGYDALDDYRRRCEQIRYISMAISSKQEKIAEGVDRLLDEMSDLKGKIAVLNREKNERILESITSTTGSLCLFEEFDNLTEIRNFVNRAQDKAGRLCAVFSGDDSIGYKYVISSKTVDLTTLSKDINLTLGGKGGGSCTMIQGSCTAKREEIENFIARI